MTTLSAAHGTRTVFDQSKRTDDQGLKPRERTNLFHHADVVVLLEHVPLPTGHRELH